MVLFRGVLKGDSSMFKEGFSSIFREVREGLSSS